MKTRLLTIMLVALAAVTVSCKKEDPNKPYFKEIPWAEDAVIPSDMAVDLGICNHLKWRSGNLGATHAEDPGDYYAWGETVYYYQDGDSQAEEFATWKEGKGFGYDWPSYSYYTSDDEKPFSKYSGDDFSALQAEDDVARKLLGGKWRTPTNDEWVELVGNENGDIYKEWVTLNGKAGWKFTSNVEGCEGNYIFLPAAGYRRGLFIEDVGSNGYYWSSSFDTDSPSYAYFLYFYSGKLSCGCGYFRSDGETIRPVCD